MSICQGPFIALLPLAPKHISLISYFSTPTPACTQKAEEEEEEEVVMVEKEDKSEEEKENDKEEY